MIRGAGLPRLAGLTVLAFGCAAPLLPASAQALYPGALSNPGDYSFAPQDARPTGEASLGYGSRNLSSASIRMDTPLASIPGMRAFIALGASQGPDLKGIVPGANGGVVSRGGALGIEQSFLDGTTISLQGGWEQERLGFGRAYPTP